MVPDEFSMSGILVTNKKINGDGGEGVSEREKRQHYQLSPKAMITISIIHQGYEHNIH